MKITVGFSTTNGWFSKAIRMFLKAQVSHTYIRFHDPFLAGDLVFHADLPGVVLEDWEVFKEQNIVVEEYEIEDEKLLYLIQKNKRLLKRKYDWGQIWDWAWVILFRKYVQKKLSNPLDDPKKLICVEFCMRFLRELGPVPNEKLNPRSMREWMNSIHQERGWGKHTYSR